MKKSKKIAIGVLILSLVAAISVGGTLAYLTDSQKVTNTFDITDLDITLTEPNWDPDSGTEMTPGDTMYKDPTITAVENDSYMRVIVTIIDNDSESENFGKAITDADRLTAILNMVRYDSSYNVKNDPLTTGIDTDKRYSLEDLESYPTVNPNFTLASSANGTYYYNYNNVFNEGDSVVLFTNVVVPADYSREQIRLIGKFQIEVYAQAIQAKNFDSAADAFAALDVEIKNGTLQADYGLVE